MARGATARLFVAVDPPAAIREELHAWARDAAAGMAASGAAAVRAPLRLLDPQALHITLCFLGARPVAEIDAVGAAVSGCAAHVGELSLGAPVWLPPRRPRALAVEIHDRDGELARLQGALASAMAQAVGWQAERRRFKAHLTVARVRAGGVRRRRGAGAPELPAAAPALPATPPLSFTPEAVVLYRSWLSPAGARYEPLAACELITRDR